MKACTGMAVWLQPFLNSVPPRGEWSASHYGSFTPGEGCPSACWGGGWEQTKAGLDALVKKNLSSLCRKSKHDSWVVLPATCNLFAIVTELSIPFSQGSRFFISPTEFHKYTPSKTCHLQGPISNSGQNCGYPEINFYNSSKKRKGSALIWTLFFNSLLSTLCLDSRANSFFYSVGTEIYFSEDKAAVS